MLRKPPKATPSSTSPTIATGQPRANRPAGASVKPTMNTNRYHPCAEVAPMPSSPSCALDGRRSALSGADADDLLHRRDEDLPVPDPPRARAAHDRVHRLRDALVGHEHRELHLGQEVDHVLGAAVELGVALLATEALHLAHREPLHPDRREAVLHLIELEGLDDRVDPLHAGPGRAKARPAADHLPTLQFARGDCACTSREHACAPTNGRAPAWPPRGGPARFRRDARSAGDAWGRCCRAAAPARAA